MLISGKRYSSLSGCSANIASSLILSLERIFLKNFTASGSKTRFSEKIYLLARRRYTSSAIEDILHPAEKTYSYGKSVILSRTGMCR